MIRRPVIRIVLVCGIVAGMAFTAGSFNAVWMAQQQAELSDARIAALRAELQKALETMRNPTPAGTSGVLLEGQAGSRAIVDEIKRELQTEMGLVPVQLLRDRRDSFVELYSYDNRGASNYGTAGYLGRGYFITVKHGVVPLERGSDPRGEGREIVSIRLMHEGRALKARLIDAGDADIEVDPGDWAILKVDEQIDLPPLQIDLSYAYEFAAPIFRLGNDYSKGIIVSTGYVGQRTTNGLVTCLTDGHPGVSGGGVLNQAGHLVGIPVGRMQGDFRFSFILPLRRDMFRRVTGLSLAPDAIAADATTTQ
jgi:hypothetical protein